jgi:transcriptional regulator with XRE-family HTH domain
MTGFITKKIESIQTLGEKLAHHRHDLGLSREKAAKLIQISPRYIKYIENNDYKDMPADVYAVNILRTYAELLKLNPATVIDLYKKEKLLYDKTQKKKQFKKNTKLNKFLTHFLSPRTLKYAIFLLVFASVFGYIGLEINSIISPPELVIYSPSDNYITNDSTVFIEGKTEKEVNLQVNNRPLLNDKDGNFSLELDLLKGLNIIKISAQKKHSKEQVIFKKVIVTDESDKKVSIK